MPAPHAPAPAPALTVGEVLAGRLVRPLFQPIVDLSTRTVVGLEALARGPAGTDLEFPDRLFGAARAAGRLGELDMLCSERALEVAVAAPNPPPLLFVNAESGVLDQPLSPRLVELLRNGFPFRQILEFTERALPAVPGSLLRVAGIVHRWGNGLALDDVGADPMSLAFLPLVEPEVIKLDMSIVRNPDAPATRATCEVVRDQARRTGAILVAEGIETEEDFGTARELGAHWGQGWLFGRPVPIEQAGDRFDVDAAGVLPKARPGFHQPAGTPFSIAAGHGPVVTADPGAVAVAMARLRDTVAADAASVVVTSQPLAGTGVDASPARWAEGAGSLIVLDDPIPGEFAAVVLGPGHGYAVCIQSSGTTELVALDHLPTVATIARVLLNRHR
ncbi:EAL domain-containing protein [Actinoplanes sp. NPDC049548]|uniref:EAL domain-containing protein n=1 Tax=Actinoplanes sp. NPDC049548 TaxID=3155152 RepID=UPI00341A69E3